MSKFRIVALDKIADEGLETLRAAEDFEVEVRTGLSGEELKSTLAEFDGAILRSGVKITPESLEGNRRLKALVRAGVGTDNIDKTAATRMGVVVMNTPTGNTLSTAEQTFALMLAQSRNVAPANQSLLEGRWDRKSFMGSQLADKTLGIVGMGRIGREVAKRALAFEMRVIAYDPFFTDEQATKLGVERSATVDEMLPKLDYMTVHTPLTDETKYLVNRDNLSKLKPGVRLINCARGGIYEETALLEGLESGQIGGLGLDVFEEEPCKESPLFGKPGVVCTPHLGASTEEAQTQVAVEGVHLLMNFFRSGEIRHAVNVAALDPKTLEAIRGYLNAAYRLGLLMASYHGGSIDSCRLTYRGEVADRDTNVVTNAFCAGLLKRALADEVNVINAQMLLKDRGISLTENRDNRMGAFASSMTVEVSGDKKTAEAGVTLFGNSMPRLINLDGYRLEAYLDGKLLIFTHTDVPGIIGLVGTSFGQHDVNIAQMAVGREMDRPGGAAIGVLNVDSTPPDAAIESLLANSAIDSVQMIDLPAADSMPSWLM